MIKRLFKTLVAVLTIAAAATGPARAQWTGGTYTATATENLGAITVNGNATLTINSDVTVTVTGGINVASGTLTVKGPGTLVVTGANGNDGWYDDWDAVAYPAGNGGAAISGNIIVQDGAVVTATGGAGGNAGDIEAPYGGIGGVAFAGTLTYKGGTVTATGGAGGRHKNESSASDGKAFANNVDFTQTTVEYTLTDGSNTITTISNQKTVIIIPTYTVRMAAGTEDAANWSIASGNASVPGTQVLENVMSGSQVTATYSGTQKVKSVKAVKYVPPAATVTTAPSATAAIIEVGSTAALVNAGAANGGTMMYAVTTTNAQPASTADFSAAIPTAEGRAAGTYYVWYYAKADADHSDSEIAGPVSVTLAVMTTVTWNSSNVFNSGHQGDELDYWSPNPLTYEGIMISKSGPDYSSFYAYSPGSGSAEFTCWGDKGDSFTFTAPSGKKFCKIEIISNSSISFDDYGDWTLDVINDKIVWSGTAANAVTLGTVFTGASPLNSIVFKLIDAQ